MDNKGKLLEAWIVTCSHCGDEKIFHWENGTNMSRAQASHLTLAEGWEETDDGWICDNCSENGINL